MEVPPPTGTGPEPTGSERITEHEVPSADPARIYVASLSDYKAGYLHGAWLEADQEPDELQVAINDMLGKSPSDPHAEEFAVHDFEGFGEYRVEEFDSLDWLSRVARGIGEQGLAFAAWAAQCDHDQDLLERFESVYLGEWDSTKDYAEELLTDLGYVEAVEKAVPEAMQPYARLDAEAFATDLILSGDVHAVESERGGVWLFEGKVV